MVPNIKAQYFNCKILIAIIFTLLIGCIGAGTLGGFDSRVFPISKNKLVIAIDSLYKNNRKYQIPEKWKKCDDWTQRGYGFLDYRIFYFQSDPEEMYYVTFIGDSLEQSNINEIEIAIRAVWQDSSEWILEKDCGYFEKKRIEKRFDQEIISKLEHFSNSKAKTIK